MTSWMRTILFAGMVFVVVKSHVDDADETVTNLPESKPNLIAVQNRLKEKLLTGYQKDTLPINGRRNDFIVSINPYLLTIGELDEVQEMLSAVAFIYYGWIDESIQWNTSDHNDVENLQFDSNRLWTPNFRVYNLHHAMTTAQSVIQENTVFCSYTGHCDWWRHQIMHATCNLDLTYFPFDIQYCNIRLVRDLTYALPIRTSMETSFDILQFYTDNGAWRLDDYTPWDAHFGEIQLNFTLHRKPMFVVVNVLSPIVVLVFLTPLVFMLPKDSGERVSYAVTVLLALSVYMTILSDNLPANSDPMPRLSVYLLVFYIITALIGLVIMLNLKILKAKETRPVPLWVKRFVVVTRCLFGCTPCKTQAVVQETEPPQTEEEEGCLSRQTRIDKGPNEATGICPQRTDVRWIDVSNSVDLVCMCVIYLVEIGLFLSFYIGCLSFHHSLDGKTELP